MAPHSSLTLLLINFWPNKRRHSLYTGELPIPRNFQVSYSVSILCFNTNARQWMGFKNAVWDLLKYTHHQILRPSVEDGVISANIGQPKIGWYSPLKQAKMPSICWFHHLNRQFAASFLFYFKSNIYGQTTDVGLTEQPMRELSQHDTSNKNHSADGLTWYCLSQVSVSRRLTVPPCSFSFV